jgi:HAD superfamily hydrolase (TIGR01490 family)
VSVPAGDAGARPALALFDFDGTLTTHDMLPAFVRGAVTPMHRWLGTMRLLPWLIGYRHGRVSGTEIRRRLAHVAFRGMPESTYRAAGERFAREVLPRVLRPDAMARLQWHRDRGDTVVVVSGSFDVYLDPWCREHGIALLCSSLEVVDGRLTGRYAEAQCVGDEKARRVCERYDLAAFDAIHAYGDTPEDRAMLGLAGHRWYRGRPLS